MSAAAASPRLGPRLGMNLSFCVKRWVTPDLWGPILRDELGIDLAQLSFDLVDPMWPDDLLADLAGALREVPSRYGVEIHSAFVGLAHYSFNQLLHPEPRVRDYAEAWLGRACRFAAQAGIKRVGGPLGAIAARIDGVEEDALGEEDFSDLIARMKRISEIAAQAGLVELLVEPTPLRREWPWSIAQARRMADAVAGCPTPWRYCVDWGHAVFEPLYGQQDATMKSWLEGLADHIGAIHIQQTDGALDRHWDFTATGIVDPGAAVSLVRRSGLADRPVFLEVFYPFERDDRSVLDAMRRTAAMLKQAFA